jgi:hypothetical protein
MNYVGIDPGKNGAIVSLNVETMEVKFYKMPLIAKKEYDIQEFFKIMNSFENSKVITEDVHAIANGGAKSTFEFGKGVMMVECAIVSGNLPYVKVQPKIWQKVALQGVPIIYKGKTESGKDKVDTKGMALIAATRLFPNTEFHFGGRASVPHNGIVDALLMAYYGKVMNL